MTPIQSSAITLVMILTAIPSFAESRPDVVTSGSVEFGVGLSDQNDRGQTFIIGQDGVLTRLDVFFSLTDPQLLSPNVRWRLESFESGEPSGNALASGDFTIQSQFAWIPLETAVTVKSGDELALIMADDTPTVEALWWTAGAANGYADGERIIQTPTGWTPVSSPDHLLRAWVRPTDVDQQSADGSLSGIAIADPLPIYGQQIITNAHGILSEVRVRIDKNGSRANLLWELAQTDPLGLPTTTIVASGVVREGDIPAGVTDICLPINPPPIITPGIELAIVLQAQGDTVPLLWMGSDERLYEAGIGVVFDGRWRPTDEPLYFAFSTHVAPLSCPCACDDDLSGTVTITDLIGYLADWFEESPYANRDLDDDTDITDLIDFLACWFDAIAGTTCR